MTPRENDLMVMIFLLRVTSDWTKSGASFSASQSYFVHDVKPITFRQQDENRSMYLCALRIYYKLKTTLDRQSN